MKLQPTTTPILVSIIPLRCLTGKEELYKENMELPNTDFPQTKAEARKWLNENRKKSRSDFTEFVKYYIEHRAELNLSECQTKALFDLREMWVKSKGVYDFQYYFKMKDHHTILNNPLLYNNDIWKKYIHEFLHWRTRLMFIVHLL